jgi:threonine dehydrogenase-like Zn-dependent dehydrogenase
VVGIHALPGGFAPWVLAPIGALVPLPPGIDPVHGTLLEPFAAAWHAVETIAPRAGDTVAVLGPGKLGSLLVAALVAYRERSGASLDVLAVVRNPGRAAPAAALGATRVVSTGDAVASGRMADVVVDATGSPAGLATALRLARREVHVKTTSGEPACGLAHATELVVDELRIARARDAAVGDDVAVVASLAGIDAAIRPVPGVERARVRPRGLIALADDAAPSEPLVRAILEHGIRITTSRCGDFHRALGPFVASLPRLERAGLVTHVLAADRLAYGYATARSAAARKVVVRHG